jgi:DNA-binding NarL/FixJ family response regulator
MGAKTPATLPGVLSVLVADDNLLMREGMRAVVNLQDGLEAVGAAVDYEDLLGMAKDLEPDVVLTDIRMPPSNEDEGIRAACELRRTHPHIGVIVLSQYLEASYALALIEGGSERRGYLLKERVFEPSQLTMAVQSVAAGGSVIDPDVVARLLAKQRSSSPLDTLSNRELDILREIAQGRTNAAIAEQLFIAEKTVQKHINSMFAKLGLREDGVVNRRVQAVLLYLQQT